jgi:hypothetical protein
MLVIPRTKHIASRMLDFPEPLRPVMALKEESHPVIWVRTGYDLNPIQTIESLYNDTEVKLTLENELFYPHLCVEQSQ